MKEPRHYFILSVSDWPDPDLVTLAIEIVSGPFSGKSAGYIAPHQLALFVADIERYPLSDATPAKIETLHIGGEGHVAIKVSPYDRKGHLVVEVRVGTDVCRSSPEADLQQTLMARFVTEYQTVADFALQLRGLMTGEVQEATLVGWRPV